MKRPKDEDYRTNVTYLYALEKYADWLEGQPSWKALAEKTQQIKELKYLLLENDNQLEFHGVSKTTVLRAKNKRALKE